MASVANSNGETTFSEFCGLRFARDAESSLFVPERGAFGGVEIRIPALSPPPSGARRVAMLIDGDNAQPSETVIKRVLSAAQERGEVTVRRVYGNWSSGNMSGWNDLIRSFGMRPVHQVSTAAGKNAADMALAIDAMDLMLGGNVDGFCIVSSDSDYTGLAIRIREQGMFAIGAGRRDTPQSFVKACDDFLFTDNAPKPKSHPKPKPAAPKPQPDRPKWALTIAKAIDENKKADGWAHLSAVANRLRELKFDWNGLGHTKLSRLIATRPDLFSVKGTNTYVRNKS